MDELLAKDVTYQANPLAGQQRALAQNMFQAQMPGTEGYQAGIRGNQAATVAAAERSGENPLLASANAATQANQAQAGLSGQEASYKQNALSQLGAATQGEIAESDKVFQDKLRKQQFTASIQGAQNANAEAGWGDIQNLGMGMANFAGKGGFKKDGFKPNATGVTF